jgi:hypothetical protein
VRYIGDFAEDSTVRIVLTTNNRSGAAVAPLSAFEADDFRIYKNGSATQKATTNGITITSPFDSVTGLHILEIDTSNDTGDSGFWTTAADYWVVATPDETIDSQTVVAVIATFSIQNRYSSARLAAIETDTQDIQGRLPAALVSGRIDASVGAMAANTLTASALATDAVTEIQSGLATSTQATAIEADTVDIQSRLPATLDSGNMRSSVQSMAADTLTASALAADAVAEIAAAVGGSGGSGARTVTITVTLNSNAVEGATVRLTKSAETYTGTTNASGVVTFNVDDGTWTVAITAAGASFAGASLVVDGNETQTYTLTATSITPSSTGLVTGYWVCYSHLGVVESGVLITMICKKVPAESGFALDSATRTATSGADGIAQFANLIPGATYQVARGSGQNFMIKVPDDATDTIELNSILGT